MQLSQFLDFEAIRVDMAAGNKRQLLNQLAQIAAARLAFDPSEIADAIADRERLGGENPACYMLPLLSPKSHKILGILHVFAPPRKLRSTSSASPVSAWMSVLCVVPAWITGTKFRWCDIAT